MYEIILHILKKSTGFGTVVGRKFLPLPASGETKNF